MPKQTVDHILFGAAYYDEYMPLQLDRIDTDMQMMKRAGMNVIRIAESTWSTLETQPGVFDFTHIDRALEAAERHCIDVIVGTPTYAVPTWLVAMHPDVLAPTPQGEPRYGARQIMDITNASYRYYGERVIRKLIAHVANHPRVIGYQVDNETKYYDCVSGSMQHLFMQYLREKFSDNLDALNAHFGLDYWSNRINSWQDYPDVTSSINQSLRGEFDVFRRAQVAEFLAWQTGIVREYARDDQFITHNFDFEWRGYSFGVQPAVDHYKASRCLDITGVDIYHPTEDHLTGKEIAFGGDVTRSTKQGRNYLVLETEAQGQMGWLPYPGQLRLQAYSHLASGADGVMYWHWHSIHNSFETYWKGVLSHDFEPNPTYEEAGVFGREVASPGVAQALTHLRKRNRVAIMVNNESLSALDWFHIETGFPFGGSLKYNDVVRRVYDAFFELNVECDIVPDDAGADRLSQYSMIVVPTLYCASDATMSDLRQFVSGGGHLVATFRSFVTNEEVKVFHDEAPHHLTDVFGVTYNQFTTPEGVGVRVVGGNNEDDGEVASAEGLIELLKPSNDTTVLARYEHKVWNAYAAITRHAFGAGDAQYIGTLLPADVMKRVLLEAVRHAGITSGGLALATGGAGVVISNADGLSTADTVSAVSGLAVRQGVNAQGQLVTYLLNYNDHEVTFGSPLNGTVVVEPVVIGVDGTVDEAATASNQLHVGDVVVEGQEIAIGAWNVVVLLTVNGQE